MDREVILDIVLDTTPIPIADKLIRKQYADRFRSQAAKWRTMPSEHNPTNKLDFIEECRNLDSSGKLIIAAYKARVLPDVGVGTGVGGLHQLVREYTRPQEQEEEPLGPGRARLLQCPTNLFFDVVGGNRIPVLNTGDGLKITGPRFGGLGPRLDPGILDLPRNERYAACFEILAGLIEFPDTRDAASHEPAPAAAEPEAWSPPEGFVGTKTITSHSRFRKHGKNPPRTTIDGWIAAAKQRGEAPERHYAQGSGELFLREDWVMNRIASWNPRDDGQRS